MNISIGEGGGGVSNGGMLYHEVQESKLCAVHCVNTVLQGPFFSEFDLAALASDLDLTERQMMLGSVTGDFLPEHSHNVSLDGDFSIQVRLLESNYSFSGFPLSIFLRTYRFVHVFFTDFLFVGLDGYFLITHA